MTQLIFACFLAVGTSAAFADQPVPQIEGRIVVSGFEPFGGRNENASFQLAKRVAAAKAQRDVTLIEIPVVWGAPEKSLAAESRHPWTLWLAFGEGSSVFRIETVADNQRAAIPDNNAQTPTQSKILADAPAQLTSAFPGKALAQALQDAGLPAKVSTEAGNYLCEEMLFNLLHVQTAHPSRVVLFIHTPVLGAKVRMPDGSERVMNEELMDHFARAILPSIETALAAAKQ